MINSCVTSTARFCVTTAAREAGIVNPVVAIYRNITSFEASSAECKVYDERIVEIMQRLGELQAKVKTPEIQGFRQLYKGLGSKVEPAGERLLRNCKRKETFPRYGNLVDAYNLVALELISPVGAHDASALEGKDSVLFFKRANGDEEIVPAFSNGKVRTIKAGDFTYGITKDGKFNPFAWLGKEDLDSQDFQITKESRSILVTAIGHATTTLEHNIDLCNKVFELLKLSCPQVEMELCMPTFVDQ